LAQAIAPLRPSTRATATLCAAFARGNETSRRQLLEHPELLLRTSQPPRKSNDPAQQLERDVGAVGGIARRAFTRVHGGAIQQLLPPERVRLHRAAVAARHDVEHLVSAIEKEVPDAG